MFSAVGHLTDFLPIFLSDIYRFSWCSVIVDLFLGYLRSEKCKGAVREFLQCSPHLRDLQSVKDNKLFSTRVNGLSLTDLLQEYADISSFSKYNDC